MSMAFEISKESVEAINIKECLFEGWEILKGNPIQIFIAFLFLLVGSLLTIGILAGSLFAGYIDYIQRVKSKDESAKPTDVFSKLNLLVPALMVFGTSVLITLANNMIIGGILGNTISILTGIIVTSFTTALFSISIPMLASGKSDNAGETIGVAWNTYLLSPATFILLSVASTALSFIGILFFGIGIVVTAPLIGCMMAVVSEKLVGPISSTETTQVI